MKYGTRAKKTGVVKNHINANATKSAFHELIHTKVFGILIKIESIE
jgi:hypothetical protein